jgi:hypothetical protein
MESEMKLVNDEYKPQLVGIITEVDDLVTTSKIVDSLNQDLIELGFDKYKYKTVQKGNGVYIERVETL